MTTRPTTGSPGTFDTVRRRLLSAISLVPFLLAPMALKAQKECLVLPAPPILGQPSSFIASSEPLLPDEPITSIQVRIETGSGIFTNDTDDVWLDLGPRAWKIGDEFKSGSTTTKLLTQSDIDSPYFEVHTSGKLRVKDLAYVRLEKKGICGLTDAPDSLLDLAFPGGATPANLLPSARVEVEKAQAALGAANSALKLHEELIHKEQAVIDDLNTQLSTLLSLQTTAEKAVIDLDTGIQQKQLDLERGLIVHFEPFVEHYMNKICGNWLARLNVLCLVGVPSTRIATRATRAWLDAMQWILDQRAKAAAAAKNLVQLQADVEAKVRTKAVHTATLNQLIADKTAETGVQTASSALDIAKQFAKDLDNLAREALSGIDVPQPGQWSVQSISVAINGKALTSFKVDRRLRQHHSSVQQYIHSLTPEDEFMEGLRANMPQEKNENRPNQDEVLVCCPRDT